MTLMKVRIDQEVSEVMDFILVECCRCATPFLMTKRMNRNFRENKDTFYCPIGHPQGYYGKNEKDKLEDELKKLRIEKDEQEQELQNKWLDEMNRANKLDRKLKRVHNGVCPCCKRSFENLRRHMETKHPEISKP
jgi:hypothetical protein